MVKPQKTQLTAAVIAILVLILLGGIGLMFYPILSANYAASHRSEIQTSYEEIIKKTDTSQIDAIREAAQKYNRDLAAGVFSPLEYEENGYYQQLLLPDTKIMCFISIPKIDVYLPVYHSVQDSALDRGAGHMEQSSLPVGGENTHAVISAHTGMAQSPMFTDLELLDPGDIFQIKVLGETLTYQVDNIEVVLPQVVDVTHIQTGRDMVSLITCTPYGINSHRLVVQGVRIETPPEEEIRQIVQASQNDNVESVWTQQYWRSVKLGIGIVLLFLMIVLIVRFAPRLLKKLQNKNGHNEK